MGVTTGVLSYSISQNAFKQKMYIAKLYADKLDTLASERFTIIDSIHQDEILGASSSSEMLEKILQGKFMYCIRGYSCGYSVYDATFLASIKAYEAQTAAETCNYYDWTCYSAIDTVSSNRGYGYSYGGGYGYSYGGYGGYGGYSNPMAVTDYYYHYAASKDYPNYPVLRGKAFGGSFDASKFGSNF